MSSQYNGIIAVDPCHLERKLKTVGAVQNQIATYLVTGVPSYATSVRMTVFNEYEEGFPEITGSKLREGEWELTAQDYCFPDVGDVRFELNALSGDEQTPVYRPLGTGKIRVAKFYGKTFEPAPHPEQVVANAIRDKDGGVHKIVAKDVGTGGEEDWTSDVGKRLSASESAGLAVIEVIPDDNNRQHPVKAANTGTEKEQEWSVDVGKAKE